MKRLITKKLIAWKNSSNRKPLLLRGARQVGKTWALMDFGKSEYQNLAYFNFDLSPEFGQYFLNTKDPKRIIENIAAASMQPIKPNETLIVFDEIQACPECVAALKYFCELAPDYHVACAGSLLGVALSHPASFPVGKVNVLDMYPMVFREFLDACGETALTNYLDEASEIKQIPDAIFNPLLEKLRIFMVVGGMPEAVLCWINDKDMGKVDAVLHDLLQMYTLDFQKHSSNSLFPKIQLVWNSLPAQLSRENKKFLYSTIKESARGREFEDAVRWLINAGLLLQVVRVSKPGLPLSAYDQIKAFKLYMLDVGLLRRSCSLAPSVLREGDRLFTEFKGALAENFVLQEMLPALDMDPRYWAVDNPHYEVDFIIQQDNQIIPIEVKSGENVKAKSLKHYRQKYPQETPIAVRLSLRNLSQDEGLINVPLFMAGNLTKLLGYPH